MTKWKNLSNQPTAVLSLFAWPRTVAFTSWIAHEAFCVYAVCNDNTSRLSDLSGDYAQQPTSIVRNDKCVSLTTNDSTCASANGNHIYIIL